MYALIPRFQTERLKLRAYHPDDLPFFLSMLANREVIRYLIHTEPWPQDKVEKWLDICQQGWDEHGHGFWILEHKMDRRPIGWGGLNWLPETEETEVLYALDQPYWGQGLATEAAQFSVNYGFETIGLMEIIGLVIPENIPSLRVLEKSGLKFTGMAEYFGCHLRRYMIHNSNL